ncbi:hypothetical protein AB5I41_11180 [Sphingomonas sp. MMS24-JH45]
MWNDRRVVVIADLCRDPTASHLPSCVSALSLDEQIARVRQQSEVMHPHFTHEVLVRRRSLRLFGVEHDDTYWPAHRPVRHRGVRGVGRAFHRLLEHAVQGILGTRRGGDDIFAARVPVGAARAGRATPRHWCAISSQRWVARISARWGGSW